MLIGGGSAGYSLNFVVVLFSRLSLAALNVAAAGGPVVTLVLVAANTKSLGPGYGLFDTATHAIQMMLTLLMILSITPFTYKGPLALLMGVLAANILLSLHLSNKLVERQGADTSVDFFQLTP